MILETERLILKEMDYGDLQDLADILQNPKVMYAYEHYFTNSDVQEWLERQQKRYKDYGFGLWLIVLKLTNEIIGQAGITWQPYKGNEILEIGYLLKEKYWHCGYAKEAAKGCKNYAFSHLNQDKVYSIIKADNKASINVAKSIGMDKVDEFITEYYHGKMLHYLYLVHKN